MSEETVEPKCKLCDGISINECGKVLNSEHLRNVYVCIKCCDVITDTYVIVVKDGTIRK